MVWRKSSFLGLVPHHHLRGPGVMLESLGAGFLLLEGKYLSPYPLVAPTPALDHFLPFARSQQCLASNMQFPEPQCANCLRFLNMLFSHELLTTPVLPMASPEPIRPPEVIVMGLGFPQRDLRDENLEPKRSLFLASCLCMLHLYLNCSPPLFH